VEPTVKGFFLKGVVDEVKRQKGKEGLKRLEELMGGPAHFAPFKDYPMKDMLKLYDSVAELLFGENNDDTQLEVGKLTVTVYTNSIVGKTMLSLLGRDIKKTALSLPRIFDTVGSGFEFETEDLGPQKVKIRIKNDPFNIHFRKGMFMAGVEAFGRQPTIVERTLGPGDYEFEIEWNDT
jgi:uncharacterized protein (TIGR02265 family)